MSRVDIMVDLETLGTKTDATIFQLSAVKFDIDTGESLPIYDKVADISVNERPLVVDGGTLQWWLSTDKSLLDYLLNHRVYKGKSSEEMLRDFHRRLEAIIERHGEKSVYLWGNGINFDNRMLQEQMESLGLKYPIHFRNDRDVRTILELASVKEGVSEKELKDRFTVEGFTAHDALEDAKYQARLVSGCYNILTK